MILAKKIKNRPTDPQVRHDFAARINYVASKASSVKVVNLAGDWQDAGFQMQASAGLNPRLRAPACHFILSWPETEYPTDAKIIAAAKMTVRELGAAGHQYVVAVHRDRANAHGHVVLNRVHPISGKSLSLAHDHARFERACRRIEHHMGWPPDRGRFDCAFVDGELELVPKPAAHWQRKIQEREIGLRPDSHAIRKLEQRSGLPSLRDLLLQNLLTRIRKLLNRAQSWQQIHLGLRQVGLRFIQYRSGARIT